MKKNYFLGILGAIIGAILSSVPWILMYVYGEWILSILATLIAFGSFKFYKWFGGKVDKKTWTVIVLSSILSIVLATFVISPMLMVIKEGQGFSVFHFKLLYTSDKFVSAIIRDFIISLIFTILGISGVVSNIKKEGFIEDKFVNEEPIDLPDKTFEEQVTYLEGIYGKYNAFSKETAVSEMKIMRDVNAINKLSFMMKMEKAGIIVAPLLKSYFDKEAVNNTERAKGNLKKSILPSVVVVVICVLIPIVLTGIVVSRAFLHNSSSTSNDVKVTEKVYSYQDISIRLPDTYLENSNPNSNYTSFYNLSETINSVSLQQLVTDEPIDKQSYYEVYATNLKQSFKIKSQKEETLQGLNGIKFYTNSIDYPEEYYNIYCFADNLKVYIIMFGINITDSSSADAQLTVFDHKSQEYLDTIEIKAEK